MNIELIKNTPTIVDNNDNGWTVAVYQKNKKYDPEYRLKDNYTTAMKVAQRGKIVFNYWNHDPKLKDKYGKTVQDYLIQNNIQVPEQWRY